MQDELEIQLSVTIDELRQRIKEWWSSQEAHAFVTKPFHEFTTQVREWFYALPPDKRLQRFFDALKFATAALMNAAEEGKMLTLISKSPTSFITPQIPVMDLMVLIFVAVNGLLPPEPIDDNEIVPTNSLPA